MKHEPLKRKMKRSFACDYHKSSISRFEHIIIWTFVKVYIFNIIFFFSVYPWTRDENKQDTIQCEKLRLGTEMTDR